jgi:hypothetical protein
VHRKLQISTKGRPSHLFRLSPCHLLHLQRKRSEPTPPPKHNQNILPCVTQNIHLPYCGFGSKRKLQPCSLFHPSAKMDSTKRMRSEYLLKAQL